MAGLVVFLRWNMPHIEPSSVFLTDATFPCFIPVPRFSVFLSECSMHIVTGPFVLSILYWIKCLWLAFAPNKHIFKYRIVPDRFWKSARFLFPYHRIMQIKSALFGKQRLLKRCAAFRSVLCLVANNPNDHPPRFVMRYNSRIVF